MVHAPGRTTHAVSEHALMLMLALARRLTELDSAVKRGAWGIREGYEGFELRGKRLAVIGLGAIGRRIAEARHRARHERRLLEPERRAIPACPLLELDELVSTADVIQICVALTPETHGLIGPDQFARMKPGVLLVNTARAQIIDHQALLAAIRGGVVGGYGTDVWDPEPPATGDPLVADERVVVTPHVAGLTDVTYREICVGPAAAAVAILAGEPP